VPLLVEFFLQKYQAKMHKKAVVGEGVMEALMRYDFPGNVRELENMVEQAVALCAEGVIRADDIIPESARPAATPGSRTLAAVVDAAEKSAIEAALRECEGSRERAADLLQISATTLWRKMTRLHITGL
jgi:two-component system response regulator HydG